MIDLLSRIEQELQERMETLHPAVEECDRLQADLTALEVAPEQPVVPEPSVEPGASAEPEPSARATRLPVHELPRTRMVSSKVARLMLAPRRPSLDRSGARSTRSYDRPRASRTYGE
jgi:hypothetical protein